MVKMKSDSIHADSLLTKECKKDDSKFLKCLTLNETYESASNSLPEKCISSDDDRENENPEQPRGSKRKNSSREPANGDKPKMLKKNSNLESIPSSETIVTLTSTQNENSNVIKYSPYNQDSLSRDYFSLLPDEVLLDIFKFFSHKPTLVNCACVCRRWKNVVCDVELWSRIELSQRRIEPGVMEIVLSRKPIILRMSQAKVITPIFKNVEDTGGNVLSKIEYLDLSMASILPNDLEFLLRTCHNLLKLSLEFVIVNEGVCNEIAKNSKLTVLNLAQSGGLNEFSLKIILTNCEKLNELHLGWTNLNAAAIRCVCQYVSKDIVRLNLSGCVKEMTDHHVRTLVLRCTKLKELDLSDATNITENSIQAICDNLNSLEILSLSRCYNIYPSSYSKLFRLPSIEFINIFGLFTESQIETLRKTSDVKLNMMKFSYVARPTVGHRRTSIWCKQVRD